MSTEIKLSAIDQAELKLIEEHGGEDWSNEHVEAAAAAFEAVQAFSKKMERRPSHAAFQMMTADWLREWMSDAYISGDPLFED